TTKNSKIKPDFSTPRTGGICCSVQTTTDNNNFCSSQGLTAYCCGRYYDNRKKTATTKGGCDPIIEFPVGRLVESVATSDTTCSAIGAIGFIGCVRA
ncbi:hypothetical protein PgNI_05318, partial [Pyricularia grisea]|uniref:Uncharacterized protein n=1 Tax=Pyricularia grisea TaxID=148305 RepID=A0A6P8B5U8_PYRGI